MKLAFKRILAFGFYEKEVPIILNLGTLEAICRALSIEFWQIAEAIKKNNHDFTLQLLYQGYIMACKDRYKKPKYTIKEAAVWKEYLSQSSQKELLIMITTLFGEITKASVKKKGAAKRPG